MFSARSSLFALNLPEKFLWFILGFFFFMGFPLLVRSATFSDVPEGTPFSMAIETLKSKGVIKGYDDGTFKPDQPIKRAEAVKILLSAAGKDLSSSIDIDFSDVGENDWFYSYVRKAVQDKIVAGYSDGTFKPGNNMKVAESLKIVPLSFGVTVGESVGEDVYPDVPKDLWFAPYAAYTKLKNVSWSLDDGNLHGEREITRGEFAEMVFRMMYIQEQNLEVFPLSTTWRTYQHATDHYQFKYPYGYLLSNAGNNVILWKRDDANGQVSFLDKAPNGAVLILAVDKNEDQTSFANYIAWVRGIYSLTEKDLRISTLNSYPFASFINADSHDIHYYFELPNKTFLFIYAKVGDGLNKTQLNDQIRYLTGSVRYLETAAPQVDNNSTPPVVSDGNSTNDIAQFLSDLRLKILVNGEGEAALQSLGDGIIIETDAIGIGTGPIDYYYSSKYDVTLKYERNSKTILGVKETKSTNF